MKNALGILLLFLALNAFGGGYYGMAGAKDVPVEWLEGSPFNNYFLPALILFVIVGGSSLTASLLVFRKHKKVWTITVKPNISRTVSKYYSITEDFTKYFQNKYPSKTITKATITLFVGGRYMMDN